MARLLINPDDLRRGSCSHVAIGVGNTLVQFAGQVAFDASGAIVGVGDLRAQVQQCMRNLKTAMDSVGADWGDITHRRVYVKEWGEGPRMITEAMNEITGDVEPPAQTMLQVVSFAVPEFLVEIEATAVISRPVDG